MVCVSELTNGVSLGWASILNSCLPLVKGSLTILTFLYFQMMHSFLHTFHAGTSKPKPNEKKKKNGGKGEILSAELSQVPSGCTCRELGVTFIPVVGCGEELRQSSGCTCYIVQPFHLSDSLIPMSETLSR